MVWQAQRLHFDLQGLLETRRSHNATLKSFRGWYTSSFRGLSLMTTWYHATVCRRNFPFPCHVAIDRACEIFASPLPNRTPLLAEDVGVTSVEDGHGGASEELSAGSTQLDLSEEVSQKHSPSRENRSLLRWVGDTGQTTVLSCPP
ncbi:hypothetical protein FJTKL_10784 [Diaporthe vaccinii]|uniref:Uncharacterized protein n=1 Tax=Diaporthe vaccinii TaxID=105482 RepID=A0ABR4FBR9_9PEZI